MRMTTRLPSPRGWIRGVLWGAGTWVLAGCASAPPKVSAVPAAVTRSSSGVIAQAGRDGADANPPAALDQVPDAEPRVEPIRVGGPNKPYEALGREYVPITQDRSFSERGLASWYGRKFHGRRTSSGELYDMYAMTAAHPTLPIPSYARVRNPANGREVLVRVNDRGPFHSGRIIDLSYTAALKLDLLRGTAPVEVERITFDEIRAGSWRRASPADALQLASREGSATREAAASERREAAEGPAQAAAVESPIAPVSQVVQIAQGAAFAAVPASTANAANAANVPPLPAAPVASLSTPTPMPPPLETAGAASIPTLPLFATSGTAPTSAPDAEPIAEAPRAPAFTRAARGFWVQLGAFRQRDGAIAFQRRVVSELEGLSPLLAVFGDAALFRLQAGPYPSREEARGAAESIRAALQLVPVIVERR